MADIHAFFDRDVYVKLACCDLWSEALASFEITHPYRLPSASVVGARSILKRRSGLPDAVKEDALQRIGIMAEIVPVIPESMLSVASSNDLFNKMISVSDIDSGEAQLALMTLHCGLESRMFTGDKRFIRAIARHFQETFADLQPHIITFEDCLMAICRQMGLESVRSRLIAARQCDTTLNIALGHKGTATRDEFCEALNAYHAIP